MTLVDDLLAPDTIADPYPLLSALREHDPVHWSETHRSWMLTRYEDVSAAFQNKALSNDRVRPLLAARKAAGRSAPSDRLMEIFADWMVVSDAPAHTRLRKLSGSAFKAQRVSSMDARIAELVDRFVDELIAAAPSDRDIVARIASPLPSTVIATMLGAPVTDRHHFHSWSNELALVAFGTGGATRADRTDLHQRALDGLTEMVEYFRDLVELRRRDPGEDMLSAMMAADPIGIEGGALSIDELVGMCALLLFAGHETTTNAIANSALSLLAHPDQLAMLRNAPELIGTAVEELLRFDGPIKVVNRWVVADFEVRGKTINRGEKCLLVLPAANRDPSRFDDPDRLDITRSPNPHIAFGKGIHACIGAQVARMETRIATERLVTRLPGLRLSGPPEWADSFGSRTLARLAVDFDTVAGSQ